MATRLAKRLVRESLTGKTQTKSTEWSEGDRVVLLPFEGEPEQTGEVIDTEEVGRGILGVRVDPEFLEPGDDGIREVPLDQVIRAKFSSPEETKRLLTDTISDLFAEAAVALADHGVAPVIEEAFSKYEQSDYEGAVAILQDAYSNYMTSGYIARLISHVRQMLKPVAASHDVSTAKMAREIGAVSWSRRAPGYYAGVAEDGSKYEIFQNPDTKMWGLTYPGEQFPDDEYWTMIDAMEAAAHHYAEANGGAFDRSHDVSARKDWSDDDFMKPDVYVMIDIGANVAEGTPWENFGEAHASTAFQFDGEFSSYDEDDGLMYFVFKDPAKAQRFASRVGGSYIGEWQQMSADVFTTRGQQRVPVTKQHRDLITKGDPYRDFTREFYKVASAIWRAIKNVRPEDWEEVGHGSDLDEVYQDVQDPAVFDVWSPPDVEDVVLGWIDTLEKYRHIPAAAEAARVATAGLSKLRTVLQAVYAYEDDPDRWRAGPWDRSASPQSKGMFNDNDGPVLYFTPHPDIPITLYEEVGRQFPSFIGVREEGGDVVVEFSDPEDADAMFIAVHEDDRFFTYRSADPEEVKSEIRAMMKAGLTGPNLQSVVNLLWDIRELLRAGARRSLPTTSIKQMARFAAFNSPSDVGNEVLKLLSKSPGPIVHVETSLMVGAREADIAAENHNSTNFSGSGPVRSYYFDNEGDARAFIAAIRGKRGVHRIDYADANGMYQVF